MLIFTTSERLLDTSALKVELGQKCVFGLWRKYMMIVKENFPFVLFHEKKL